MHLKAPQLAAGLLLLVLQGCTLAPAYLRPELPVAETFPARQTGPEPPARQQPPAEEAADIGWRDYFTDPALQNLIAAALDGNRDLRATALTVESFQAQYRIQRAALLPAISGSGSAVRQRAFSSGKLATTESYALSVGVTAYELDFFGRVRSLKDDALEQYLALEETYRSARLSLVSEVAKAYLTLLADREILAITEDTLNTEEKSYSLVEQRTNEGISTQLALAQARIGLETAKVNLAIFRRLVAQDLNNLALLCGGNQPEPAATASSLGDRQPLPRLSAPLSSAVLLQRPDILAAEHQLKGAHASIGAARAAFFPTISLTANGGAISGDLAKLFDGNSGTWLFAPTITLPIFTGGRLEAQLDIAAIRREIAVAGYEEAIQKAFREVADALVARDTFQEQLTAQKANLQANQDYYSMARDRYQEGLDSSLTLLDAQRSLYAARQGYVSLRLAQLVNEVELYKVLGGGWKEGG